MVHKMKSKRTAYCSIFFSLLLLSSCSSDVDITINKEYDFTIRMQKYRTEIKTGETKELEFFIDKAGDYEGTNYYVSVFLRTGEGEITDGKKRLEENVYYEVPSNGFKLFYRSLSADSHRIEILVKNSFGKEEETIVTLSNK